MSFISSTMNFLNRNKTKLASLVAAGSAGYYIYQYINDTSNQFEHGSSGSFVERKNNLVDEVFEEVTRKCSLTSVSICKKIEAILDEEFSSSTILDQLNLCTDGDKKIELFNELKLTIFNRILSEVYSFSLFTGLWKVQISIVSAYVYLDLTNRTNFMEKTKQLEFLQLSSYFCDQGLYQLLDVVTKSVKETFGDINLDEEVDFTKILLMFAKCQDSIKNSIFSNESFIKDYFFQPNVGDTEDHFFKRLTQDLFEYLNTEDFKKCLEDSFVQGFIIIKDRILSRCLNKEKIKLALLLPRIRKVLEENSGPNAKDNPTVYFLMEVQKLKSYSENVYESIITS